jgi:uncharacterized spore protein YtfJ
MSPVESSGAESVGAERGELPLQNHFLEQIARDVEQTANSRTIFGAPIERDGITVVPVARARWGLGGGSGTRAAEAGKEGQAGVGGGGGAVISPVGFIEIQQGCAKFRAIRTPLASALAAAAGGVLALSFMRSLLLARALRRGARRGPMRLFARMARA